MADSVPSLRVRGLGLRVGASGAKLLDDVSICVRRGELLALVGESGAGKTSLGLALLGWRGPGIEADGGTVVVNGIQIDSSSSAVDLERVRGCEISYVPQNPTGGLDPSYRIGDQIAEMRRAHGLGTGPEEIAARLDAVALPADREFLRRFPHQLSGGQLQRVAIAMALCCDPAVAVLDEPTTALDVITQEKILGLIGDICQQRSTAFVYVTHDIAAVAPVATSISVMYAGRIVESGPRQALLEAPMHPYTRALIGAVPRLGGRSEVRGIDGAAPSVRERGGGCDFAPRCPHAQPRCGETVPAARAVGDGHEVRCHRVDELPEWTSGALAPAGDSRVGDVCLAVEGLEAEYPGRVALRGIDLGVRAGECLAIVGESGSGKSTLARCLTGLHRPSAGRIEFEGSPVLATAAKRSAEQRAGIQCVFQNPDHSLNPRRTVLEQIARPCRQLLGMSSAEANAEADRLLALVRLSTALGRRYPAQISGGERQRVAIARALAARPKLLICDEVTSALDVSVQAAVVTLLDDLRHKLGLAVVFISHDLALVSAIADSILVLENGKACEIGSSRAVLDEPRQPYTRALLEAAPRI